MPSCIQCLTPLHEGHCASCKTSPNRVLVPLTQNGYYLLRSAETNVDQLAVAFETQLEHNWLEMGCINGPTERLALSHSKWTALCIFESRYGLFHPQLATHTELDLWQISKRILELLVQLQSHGLAHGALSRETLHWQQPYLFFLGFRPVPCTQHAEHTDLQALSQLLSILNQHLRSRPIESFVNGLVQMRSAKTALIEWHKRQMPTVPMARLMTKSPDPLLHESLDDHLARARHRSWWSPKSEQEPIRPAQLFVGMILTICAAVAGLLTLWQFVQNL